MSYVSTKVRHWSLIIHRQRVLLCGTRGGYIAQEKAFVTCKRCRLILGVTGHGEAIGGGVQGVPTQEKTRR